VRVLFVNRSYWPDVEATGQYLTELCEDLADEFEVHVICGRPQRLTDPASQASYGTTVHRGVTIHRLPHTQFDKASFGGRVANMATFQATAAWHTLRVPRPDVMVVETDPPLLCLLGWAAQAFRRTRLVCYVQDVYPDVAVALGKLRPGWAVRLLRGLFFAAYRRADAVVVLSRDMQELVLAGGVSAGRVSVVRNWADTNEVYPAKSGNVFRRTHALEGKFVAMYSGNMGLSQRLEQVLDAAESLRDRPDIVVAFVGDGADRRRLEQTAAEKRLANVRFFDYQPKTQLADSLSAADVHLVVLRPEIKQLLMPSKLYGVMASGTPAIALADMDCELAEVVTGNDLGTVVPSTETAELAATLRIYADSPELVARQGSRAREYAVANCGRDASVEMMRGVLRDVAAEGIARGSEVAVAAGDLAGAGG